MIFFYVLAKFPTCVILPLDPEYSAVNGNNKRVNKRRGIIHKTAATEAKRERQKASTLFPTQLHYIRH